MCKLCRLYLTKAGNDDIEDTRNWKLVFWSASLGDVVF